MPGKTETPATATEKCPICRMRQVICLCPHVPKLEIRTRLVILMHYRETVLTTNTARLAQLVVPGSEIRIRGRKGEPLSTDGIIEPARVPLFLYPSDDASELTPELLAELRGPFTLIVPDGSWRQASKVVKREPALANVRRVKLRPGPLSEYKLRREPNAESLCTYEAIARSLGVLEGDAGPRIQDQMEDLFRRMVEWRLWSAGKVPVAECRYPIPPEAVRVAYEAGVARSQGRR